MPPRRRSQTRGDAAEALAGAALLAARWAERLLAAHEPPLTPAQYLALQAAADGLVGAELARRAAVSPAAVSQLLAGLEQAGLVERDAEAGDRRRRPLGLTAEGERVLRTARALLRTRLGELLGGLPAPELDALARGLETIAALLAGAPPPRRPSPGAGPPAPAPPRPRRSRP